MENTTSARDRDQRKLANTQEISVNGHFMKWSSCQFMLYRTICTIQTFLLLIECNSWKLLTINPRIDRVADTPGWPIKLHDSLSFSLCLTSIALFFCDWIFTMLLNYLYFFYKLLQRHSILLLLQHLCSSVICCLFAYRKYPGQWNLLQPKAKFL